ncbi:hypothetical protein T08_11237 [Trichinella sp. T8]|nr:hypothetical protein T08_11237 [Trichinella sp. T8]
MEDPNHDHLIGCRRGCRSAPEIASAPAASELPIGGSRRCGTTVVQEDELVASSLALNTRVCSTGCQYCRYSEESSWEVSTNRVEVQRKDDRARDSCVPERKAFELPLETTVVARIFVHFECAVATCSVSGVRESEDVREGDRHQQEFGPRSQPTPWKIHLIHP